MINKHCYPVPWVLFKSKLNFKQQSFQSMDRDCLEFFRWRDGRRQGCACAWPHTPHTATMRGGIRPCCGITTQDCWSIRVCRDTLWRWWDFARHSSNSGNASRHRPSHSTKFLMRPSLCIRHCLVFQSQHAASLLQAASQVTPSSYAARCGPALWSRRPKLPRIRGRRKAWPQFYLRMWNDRRERLLKTESKK